MATRRLYGIYGASGCGRGIMPLARAQLQRKGIAAERLVFVDDNCPSETVNGHAVMSYQTFLQRAEGKACIAIAIANGEIRQRLANQAVQDGVVFFSPRAGNCEIMDDVEIGEGACLSPFVCITSNVRIGVHFHANLYSYVEHDCVIGNFVTFAPGVKCNGNIYIEDHAYIGAGAVIRQGRSGNPLVIGAGAVVGMGAVVTKSVPAGAVVVGNPARCLVKDLSC